MMSSPYETSLSSYSDFGNVYLAGNNAGGNIVHYLLMAMQRDKENWKPMQIKEQSCFKLSLEAKNGHNQRLMQ